MTLSGPNNNALIPRATNKEAAHFMPLATDIPELCTRGLGGNTSGAVEVVTCTAVFEVDPVTKLNETEKMSNKHYLMRRLV